MSIRPAMSAAACPQWSCEQLIQQASAMGYAGIEFVTRFGKRTPEFACDPQQGQAQTLRDLLTAAKVEAACLSTNISFTTPGKESGQGTLAKTRQAIDLAAAIGAPAVRVLALELHRGETRSDTLKRVAQRAREVADYAGERGVQVLFENLGAFVTAADWWWCLDVARHPMVGMVWNFAAAAGAGEKPAVSVPMLNSRIRLAKLSDYKAGTPVPLGEGDMDIPQIIHRLMGVGYTGFASVEWDRLAYPSLAGPEEVLPGARQRLSGWVEDVLQAGQPRKPVKKPAPPAAAGAAGSAGSAPKGVVAAHKA